MSEGYAVIDREENIDLRTVFDTRRGAMVNWLHARKGIFISNTWSDEQITEAFALIAPSDGVSVASVSINVMEILPNG